jgi:hypothetical protein
MICIISSNTNNTSVGIVCIMQSTLYEDQQMESPDAPALVEMSAGVCCRKNFLKRSHKGRGKLGFAGSCWISCHVLGTWRSCTAVQWGLHSNVRGNVNSQVEVPVPSLDCPWPWIEPFYFSLPRGGKAATGLMTGMSGEMSHDYLEGAPYLKQVT